MKRILISWIATRNDFFTTNPKGEKIKANNKLNYRGPHFTLYEKYSDFDTHYLLSQDSTQSARWEYLASELRKRHEKEVILEYMNLSDITDVGSIKAKVNDFFNINIALKATSVEVFVSPGTPSMQTAWYLMGTEFEKEANIKFFKTIEHYVKDEVTIEKRYLHFQTSEYAGVTNIREQDINSTNKTPFITESLEDVYSKAFQIAGNNKTTTLIHGETGTGKEYLAKYIHNASHRKNKRYIAINCGAYQGDTLESRLFGYEAGAYTDAKKTTKGAFEDAHNGTIFLDEIGDTTPRMQVTLLRVLQERVVNRIGSTEDIPVDVRVIAASNKDLWQLCKNGLFRYDLFYRLAIAELKLPPFRRFHKKERKIWINHFLESLYTPLNKSFLKLDSEVMTFLSEYPFYGNFRELHNVIELFYTFCENKVTIENIPERILNNKNKEQSLALDVVIKKHITEVLAFCDGNISESARLLEVSINTVKSRIKTKKNIK